MGLGGFFALSIAVKEEYDEIYLLGYDFGSPSLKEKLTHYYQNKLDVSSIGIAHPELYLNDNDTVKEEVKDFELFLSPSFKSKIYNVSLISNIPYFDKISYEEFFTKLKDKNEN
jgi:hypothetical protein